MFYSFISIHELWIDIISYFLIYSSWLSWTINDFLTDFNFIILFNVNL